MSGFFQRVLSELFVRSIIAEAVGCAVNPKASAQGVALVATPTIASINIPASAHLNMGVGNFTLRFRAALPDWTPAAGLNLSAKYQVAGTNYGLYLNTNGTFSLIINSAGAANVYATSTAVNVLLDGSCAEIVCSVVRETATVAGSATFYVNGNIMGVAVAIPASATPAPASNTGPLRFLSATNDGANPVTSTMFAATFYNRALSATEVALLYLNVVGEADKWGGQTAMNVSACISTTNAYATFTGASATGFTAADAAPANNKNAGTAAEIKIVAGRSYYVEFDATLTSGYVPGVALRDAPGATTISNGFTIAAGKNIFIFVATSSAENGVLNFATLNNPTSYAIANLFIKPLGAVLDLEPEGAQPNQWHDSSSNELHATYPASGSSLTRWKADGQYNWTLPITGDTTLTGIVPAGFELRDVVIKNATAGAVSVRLGTTAGGVDVFALTALNTSATFGGFKTVQCAQGFSLTAAQTLYLSSLDWTGGGTPPSLTVTFRFRRIS